MPKTNRTNTSSSSHLSPGSPQPAWAPPRSPLPPHRLAKLANVLGVPTPIPATHAHAFSVSPPPVGSPSPSPSPLPHEMFRRSPTPSSASSQAVHALTSRYMLHVIPPTSLPHDSDDCDLTPLPPTASGYHSQFHRGVLVPLYSTLQSQLSAIAREYALPSTVGLELFLASSLNTDESSEPGARLSELIWKHLWTRVIKFEKDELTSPGHKPLGLGMNYGLASQSSPTLLQDVASSSTTSLRSVIPSRSTETAQSSVSTVDPSSSTPSQSVYTSQSEIDTPESASSIEPPNGADMLSLPGLGSNSLIPVLAKVEFEIDKRKARWYDAWIKSRKNNYAKRAESRQSGRNGSRSEQEEEGEGTRKAPIDLALVGKMNGISPSLNLFVTSETSAEPEELVMDDDEYQQLDEEEAEIEEDLTARHGGQDPLEDVFGNDADTWDSMHSSGEKTRHTDPNVVDLALDAFSISNLPNDLEADDLQLPPKDFEADEAEVSDLLEKIGRPELSVAIPTLSSSPGKRQSSPTTARRHVPPPIAIIRPGAHNDLIVPEQPLTGSIAGERLAYLSTPTDSPEKQSSDEELDDEALTKKMRSPEDDKRAGVFYDDLDLGLDPSLTAEGEYDESDPYDRRKSQYIFAAQLDELEKNLASLSPRRLQSVELKPEDMSPSLGAQVISPRSPSIASLLTPRKDDIDGTPTKSPINASWPAVPYSSINGIELSDGESRPPSPPTFAFNGISTEPPKPFKRQKENPNVISNETLARQRALQEDNGLYPPLVPPSALAVNRHAESPVIPLSPDPFGRFPSEPEASQLARDSYYGTEPMDDPLDRGSSLGAPAVILSEPRPPSHTPSSRFSIDSVTSEEAAGSGPAEKASASRPLSKSIRRLWRRSESKRTSISSVTQPPPSAISHTALPQNGQAGRARAKSISKTPLMPLSAVAEAPSSPLPIPSMPSREPSKESLLQPRDHGLPSLRFDQESPYPIHPSRASTIRSPSPPSMSRPPSQQANQYPSVTQQAPPGPSQERSSVRKSILKSWKSASGLSASSSKGAKNASTSSTPRSSAEQLPETAKKRRPSVIDLATGTTRGAPVLGELPPSPALPEQFASQMRSSSRQSQLSHTNGKPSVSSLSTSSPPRLRSPLMAVGSPPRNGLTAQPRASIDSFESRPSFDVSQFEMVSPPHNALTYPYHGLDTSLTSHE
ncbi:hypothetical protein BC835DRAFT_1307755 [Cytidiella melzeri]|nr:hypothetical protein BC835DRAFT_1307755 [Cytidiella melzeri]